MDDRWVDHGNLIVLIGWMADQAEYDKGDLAYAVEKPWKFDTEFNEAVRQQEAIAHKRRSEDCPGCGKRFYAVGDGDPLKRHVEFCELYLAMSDDE
jgi:hypothetical protein